MEIFWEYSSLSSSAVVPWTQTTKGREVGHWLIWIYFLQRWVELLFQCRTLFCCSFISTFNENPAALHARDGFCFAAFAFVCACGQPQLFVKRSSNVYVDFLFKKATFPLLSSFHSSLDRMKHLFLWNAAYCICIPDRQTVAGLLQDAAALVTLYRLSQQVSYILQTLLVCMSWKKTPSVLLDNLITDKQRQTELTWQSLCHCTLFGNF